MNDASSGELRARHVDRRAEPNNHAAKVRTSDDRWVELLAVAAIVFAEKGYRATSLQEVADRLGVKKGSLYYYINSKDDLLYEVVLTVIRGGLANLIRILDQGGTPVQRLRAVVAGQIEYLLRHRAATAVFLHEMDQLPAERKAHLPVHEYTETFRELLREGQRDGSFRPEMDPTFATMALFGGLNWVYRWYHDNGSLGLDALVRQFSDIYVNGFIVDRTDPH